MAKQEKTREALEVAELLFSTILVLIKKELQQTTPEEPSLIGSLIQTKAPEAKRKYTKNNVYGKLAEVPLTLIAERGPWPIRAELAYWPNKGDTYYRYDPKTKNGVGFVWNSKKPFPKADRRNIFESAEAAIARWSSPKLKEAAKKAGAVRAKNLKRRKELEDEFA